MRILAVPALVTAGLVALAAAATGASSAAESATVVCPAVDSGTGAVTQAPTAGVDWSGCDLTGANLRDDNLAGANLKDATLKQANLAGADLVNASLDGANLQSAVASGADGQGATLTMTTLTGVFLNGANLESADLSGVSGFGLKLIGADLKHASLTNADLTSADLTSANLFGATLTGITQDSITWTDATCPNGASADFYTAGCLSTVAVTTPSATPVITAGTEGNNGWYTSGVTVTWFWIDSNNLGTNCPATTSSTGQGKGTVISASCTDSVGNTGTDQVPVDIDTTLPVQKLTGFRNGATYPIGQQPVHPDCVTSDSGSGLALHGGLTIDASRADGSGITSLTCSGGTDQAGNVAATVMGHYTLVYELGGFVAPHVGSTLKASAATITVELFFANGEGQHIGASNEASLGSHHDVRVTLAGPGISPVVAGCTWVPASKFFTCSIPRPAGVKTGHQRYTITASVNMGSGFVTAPPDAFSENPEPVFFSS